MCDNEFHLMFAAQAREPSRKMRLQNMHVGIIELETCIEGLMNGTVQGGPKLIVCKSDVSNPTDVDLVKNKSWIRASLRFKNDRVLSAFLYADAFLIADHMLKFTMFSTTGPNDTAKIWYGLLCCFPTIV